MKNKTLLQPALLLVAFLSCAPSLLAGPPFVTDDPEPVDFHHWELYIASIQDKNGGDWSGTAPHVELNYGAVPNLQLHIIAPIAYDSPPDGPFHYGFGDLELGAKYRFIQETNGWPQIGVFPLLEVPTGSARENLGNGHAVAFLPVWAQKSWGNWTIYGGAGYGLNSFHGRGNWGFGGAVLQNQVLTNLLLGVEVYHQTQANPDFPNSGTAFNVGGVFDFNDSEHLLFSFGRSIDGPTDFQCYVAFQLTFENGKFPLWNGSHPEGSR